MKKTGGTVYWAAVSCPFSDGAGGVIVWRMSCGFTVGRCGRWNGIYVHPIVVQIVVQSVVVVWLLVRRVCCRVLCLFSIIKVEVQSNGQCKGRIYVNDPAEGFGVVKWCHDHLLRC